MEEITSLRKNDLRKPKTYYHQLNYTQRALVTVETILQACNCPEYTKNA